MSPEKTPILFHIEINEHLTPCCDARIALICLADSVLFLADVTLNVILCDQDPDPIVRL